MRYPSQLVQGVMLDRRKRFLADVRLPDGTELVAHLANTGRMTGCWAPGCAVRLSRSDNPKRKLPWSVEQTQVDGRWILVNSAKANRLVEEAILEGRIDGLTGPLRREAVLPEGGRADFLLGEATWVEVKTATLWERGDVWFPDTVTERGTRHLGALTARARAGQRAVLLICVGTEGGGAFRPAPHLDPAWAAALIVALDAGVELLARATRLTSEEAVLTGPVAINLGAP